MFTKILNVILFLFALFVFDASAQNLVNNGSFEDYINCPSYLDELKECKFWFNKASGTTDYFNECSKGMRGVSIPTNLSGYQNARTGAAYIGIAIFSGTKYTYHEYIQTELKEPLIAGKSYEIEMYISLADSAQYYWPHFTFCFTQDKYVKRTEKYNQYSVLICDSGVSVALDSLTSESERWHLVKAIYKANGGEKILSIGVFTKDITKKMYKQIKKRNKTQRGNANYAYYYIDDVRLVEVK